MPTIDEQIQFQAVRLNDQDLTVRRAATEALYEICREADEKAVTAIAPLLKCLEDPDEKVRYHAGWGLCYCGKTALRELTKRLSHPNRLVRIQAAASIGEMGRGECRTKVALRKLLNDSDSEVRRSAAEALGRLYCTNWRTVQSLRKLAESPITTDRSAAIHALGTIGGKIRRIKKRETLQDWLRQIAPALNDEDHDVRWSAYYVLRAVEIAPENALPLWIRGLDDPDDRVAGMAVDGLAELAKRANISSAIPALSRVVGRGGRCALDACRLLGKMGNSATEAVPPILEALNSDESGLVAAAAVAVWKIGQRIDESLPALANLLRKNGPGDGETVCDVLCQIGPAAAPLTETVLQMLATDDYDLQWAAADALGAIAPGNEAVVSSLITALCHKSGIVRNAAMQALIAVGDESIPGLVRALEEGNDDRREMAADALGRFGAKAALAIDSLRKMLQSKNPDVRAWSAIAMGKIAASEEVLPMLIEILERFKGPNLRRQAAEAIGNFGSAARDAVPILRSALRDDDETVRAAAKESLKEIEG